MRCLIAGFASLAALAMTAGAQEYRCENGELVGGDSGISARCTTNTSGQIVSVTPYRRTVRPTVRIYPSQTPTTHTVQTYTPSGKRAYTPAPLTPQSHVPPASIKRPGYRYQTLSTSANTQIYRPVSAASHRTQPRVITATPTPHIQRAAYTAPCSFKVREVSTARHRGAFEVCYKDIQPTDGRSVRKLYSRLKKASRRACGTDYDSILSRWSKENTRCAAASLDRAVMTSGIEPLRAYHLSKTGRAIPRVTVGQPRDAS